MEMLYYKCKVCGFVHQVPAYWTGFSPEETMEMEHFDLEKKDICSELTLKLFNPE